MTSFFHLFYIFLPQRSFLDCVSCLAGLTRAEPLLGAERVGSEGVPLPRLLGHVATRGISDIRKGVNNYDETTSLIF